MFESFRKNIPPPPPEEPEQPRAQPMRRIRTYQPRLRPYEKPYIPLGRVNIERAPGEPSPEQRMIDRLVKAIRARNDLERGWEPDGWY